jgi:hypothetical protein
MRPRWMLKRMQAMQPEELRYRAARALKLPLERLLYRCSSPSPAADASRGAPWAKPLPRGFAAAPYRAASDTILAGTFRLFGYHERHIGFPPRFNRDPESGTEAPLIFGKAIDYRNPSVVGNIKFLWEPNRHLELVTLAQAWHLSRELRYAAGCRSLIQAWLEQCPHPLGINWASALEIALRLVNWSCAWHLLGGDQAVIFCDAGGLEFKHHWLRSIYQHCTFLDQNLSRFSSANNHLLGELLGLIIGATTWPCWTQSERWRSKATHLFQEQFLLQNGEDGVNKEQAVWYQHEVLDMALLAGLTAEQNGSHLSAPFWERVEALLEFIAALVDSQGHVPAFGDSDDAVIVRFDPFQNANPYQSLLATGSVLFKRPDFKRKAGRFDDKSRWLLGDAAAEQFAALPNLPTPELTRRAFPVGGYYVLGSAFGTPLEIRAVLDTGPLGYLALAAHGHADALSVTLSAGGEPLLIDPGTYCYHTEERWRSYFRGTLAHNTVRVDGMDQSVSEGNFLWTQHARASCIQSELDGPVQQIAAEHDGYRRLADPVGHERRVVFRDEDSTLLVFDNLKCGGSHRIEVLWHFAPECHVVQRGDLVLATRGKACLELHAPSGTRLQLISGQQSPPLGWSSARFALKQPCATLVCSADIRGDWAGTTKMILRFNSPE